MIQISKDDFNKDMDAYLSKRRQSHQKVPRKEKPTREKSREPKANFFKSFSLSFRKRIPSDEEIQRHMNKVANQEDKEAEKIQEEIEDIEEAEDELEMEKESLLRRLFKKLGFINSDIVTDEELETLEQQQTIVDEEVKETVKILHKWLEQLPPDKLNKFKSSPDFQKYKELLRRLGLIKE